MSALGLGDYGSDDEDDRMTSEEQKDEQTDDAQLQGVAGPARPFSAAPDVDMYSGPGIPGSDDEARPSGEGMDADVGQPSSSEDVWSRLPAELRQPPPGEHSQAAEKRLYSIYDTTQRNQRSFIESLRNNRNYSNPDLLQQLMQVYHLKGTGTAFPPDVFDPDALPREDYADALLSALDREQEARRSARANAPPGAAVIQFERAQGAGAGLPASRSASDLAGAGGAPAAGGSTVGASLVNVAALREQVAKNAAAMAAAGASAAAGRKSKWDNR
uniref:SAP30-binding protein n=1 Tax=Chlamydomonas leiostraca TaxID=1034604 RepID=A0A7S0RV32_9CHLO|mmetsp:Transcript_32425/g.82369  ORF Transcript_32425/g.82369 Transcript_32425/m.82369 type:complete len:273 (+) Transcript_32425:53-871(+)